MDLEKWGSHRGSIAGGFAANIDSKLTNIGLIDHDKSGLWGKRVSFWIVFKLLVTWCMADAEMLQHYEGYARSRCLWTGFLTHFIHSASFPHALPKQFPPEDKAGVHGSVSRNMWKSREGREAQPREEAVLHGEPPLPTMSTSRVRKMPQCVCSRVHATHFHTEGPHSVRCQRRRLVSRDSAQRKWWWKHRY